MARRAGSGNTRLTKAEERALALRLKQRAFDGDVDAMGWALLALRRPAPAAPRIGLGQTRGS